MSSILVIFKLICILSSLLVVTATNPVHSVLFLVLVFCSAASYLFVLGVEFLALVFIVVYVGAIAVLFLFVCMMLNIKLEELQSTVYNYLPIGAFFVLIFTFELYTIFNKDILFFGTLSFFDWFALYFQGENLQALGLVIYTFNFFSFILGSLILLVAMIGAIQLTLYHRLDVRRQLIYDQVKKQTVLFKI